MPSEFLQSRLAQVRGKHVMVAVFTGLALAVALVILWTSATMWLDWNIARGLPRWARALSLVLEFLALAAIVCTRIVYPIMHAPDDEDLALMVEHEYPSFQTRLIASVQLTRPQAQAALAAGEGSRSLVAAMVQQVEKIVKESTVADVIKTKTLNRLGGGVALLVLLAVSLFLFSLPASGALLSRAFLGNNSLPTKTRIESQLADMRVALGDPLKIEVKVSGYKPSYGRIDLTYGSGRVQQLPLDREALSGPKSDTYAITLDSVQESFKYSVTVYDAVSDDFSVKALERPAVASFECFQVYPDYTALGTVPCPSGELSLLKGSSLKVRILSTKNLMATVGSEPKFNYILCFSDNRPRSISEGPTDAASTPNGKDNAESSATTSYKIPLIRSPKNPRELTSQFPLPPTLNALSIHLVDADDLESRDTAVYPVEMLPDRPPTIKIVSPDRKEVLQTAIAKFEVGFLAEDDYMLGPITLRYKIDDNPSIYSIPLQVPPRLRSLRGSYLWDLARIPAPKDQPTLEGSVVEFWLDNEDTRPPKFGGPGRGTSEHFAVRVVTAAAKQAELLARSGQTVGDIKEAEERQSEASHKTSTMINEIPGGTRQDR